MSTAVDPSNPFGSPINGTERPDETKHWVAALCGLLVLHTCLQTVGQAAVAAEAEMGSTWPPLGATLDWLVLLSSIALTLTTGKVVLRRSTSPRLVTGVGLGLLFAAGLDTLELVNFTMLGLEGMPGFKELGLSSVVGCSYVAVAHRALGRSREAAIAWGLTGLVVLLDTPLTGVLLRATNDVVAWTPLLLLRGPVHFGVLGLLWRLRR